MARSIIIDRTRQDREVPITFLAGAMNLVSLPAYLIKAGAGPVISSLSVSHAAIGAQVTITGLNFGSLRGTSTVTFGEPVNVQGWAPVTRPAASYVSWSATQIVVTVPSMSPGKVGATGTYHNVRVYVGGTSSNAASFYIDPVYTVTGQTFSNLSGAYGNSFAAICSAASVQGHDVLFDGCTFTSTQMNDTQTSGGGSTGVIWADPVHYLHPSPSFYRTTFYNCTMTSNNSQLGDGVNGVKWNDIGATRYSDLTFDTCHFGQFSRMGIEMVNNSPQASASFNNIRISNSDFLPTGGEPISFSTWAEDTMGPHAIYSLVSDCLVYGYSTGAPPSGQGYSGAVECNGSSYVEVRNTTFWGGGGLVFNFGHQWNNQASGLLVDNCIVDMHLRHALCPGVDARLIGGTPDPGFGIYGAVWRNCDFNMGDAANSGINAIWSGCGVNHLYYCDLSTSYMHGYAWGAPASSINDYWGDWDLANPYATYVTSQHNQFPHFGTRP